MASGPYMKNQRRKERKRITQLHCYFVSVYHICSKNHSKSTSISSDSHATTREQFNGDRQSNHTNDSLGRLKSRFAFIIYQRNIFSSFYLLRWVIDHELHVIHLSLKIAISKLPAHASQTL